MSEGKTIRLASAAKELNVGIGSIVEHLHSKGFDDIKNNPNTKLTEEQYQVLLTDFKVDIAVKEKAEQITIGKRKEEEEEIEEIVKPKQEEIVTKKVEVETPKILGKIDLDAAKKPKAKKEEVKKEEKVVVPPKKKEEIKKEEKVTPVKEKEVVEHIETKKEVLSGPKILGKIELKEEKRPEQIYREQEKKRREEKKKEISDKNEKKKRTRIKTNRVNVKDYAQKGGKGRPNNNDKKDPDQQVSEKEIKDKIKATMAKISGGKGKSSSVKYRREKREEHAVKREEAENQDSKILQVTEFVTVSELAGLMSVTSTEIIKACMGLGVFVSINQRLDAEIIELVAAEFGYDIQFISMEEQDDDDEEEVDAPEDLKPRPPIVTIMGHVDHGKTSLLDYIRDANVVAGEMGGITQHIGAYEVTTKNGEKITFLDTPGHEAFTAMRARGAKLTDIAIIVIAADDNVMPQTKEAIAHAQAAEVPMIFAINKIDKPGANAENVRKQLSEMNILVEDWGGKYQSQEISAKQGLNIDVLLDKVLLEAEMLELKANPNKNAIGSIIEASLDKGRGYVATIMVQEGTLKVGDFMVAGQYYGKVKAMTNERGQRLQKAGPSTPTQVLGLNGAPASGDKFKIYDDESEAKDIANRRSTIIREQGLRSKKHITLDEIGRRLALGTFKELNLIVKGDVDGSVEALSDSLLKLSTEEIQVNIIHKGVGQISESDVLLASASDAIIIAFQVRPSANARTIAEQEEVQIKHYSIIYDAIEEVKSAMEGLLEPKFEEKITGNIEVRETFKISKVGTIAGCYVLDGKVARTNKIRIIREGIVVFTGELDSLKRFKDDVKDVSKGYECGLRVKNYNDLKVGDIIEAFEQVEVKRKL
ncbi:MAG: translation initiation factor IF-2 [Chitinophagales bacterium]|nr:translation initiation factor IF-2 [Chitinophagales bacterium]